MPPVMLFIVFIGGFLQHQHFGPNASSSSWMSFSFPESVMSSGGAEHPLVDTGRALIVSLGEKWSRTGTIGPLQSPCFTVRTADCVSKNGSAVSAHCMREIEKTKPSEEEVFSCKWCEKLLQKNTIRKINCKLNVIFFKNANIYIYIYIF